jgi:hypothetical protein
VSATPHPIPGRDLVPVGKFEWEARVAELVLKKSLKLVASGLSHYANADGTSSHPGQLRLMWYCGIKDDRTVSDALKDLRALGVIYRTRAGGGRPAPGKQAIADEWQLCWPKDGNVAAERVSFDEWRKQRGA